MLRDFTNYLAKNGFYNPETLNLLIESTRDEIEARWRPNPVLFTLITLAVGLFITYYQAVFSRFLELDVTLLKRIKPFALLGVPVFIMILVFGFTILPSSWFSVASRYLSLRSERAIYLHCLSGHQTFTV